MVDKVRNIETWGRLGFAARGLVYLMLAWIALSSGRSLSTGQAIEAMSDLPLSVPLLLGLAVGLFGYGLFKCHAALVDDNDDGDDRKGRLIRWARAAGGLVYWGLAAIALRKLFDLDDKVEPGHAAGSEGLQQEAVRQVGQTAGGDVILILVGLVVIGLAVAQFANALSAKFMKNMARCPRMVRPLGRLGYLARGLVIAVVGWYLLKAGFDGSRLRGSSDALALLRSVSRPLFFLVAAGLGAFGLTSLMMAKYRHIRDDDVVERVSETLSE